MKKLKFSIALLCLSALMSSCAGTFIKPDSGPHSLSERVGNRQ